MAGYAPGEIAIIALIAVFLALQVWALIDVVVIHAFPTDAQRSRWMWIVLIGVVGPLIYLVKRKTLTSVRNR